MVVSEPPELTLFCFPCAGASATSYLRWRRRVPRWLRIEPVEPPGRGSRLNEEALRDYAAVINDLTARLRSQTLGRYALLGHSMGALLAYGCARLLAQFGAPPAALAVAATAPPSCRPAKNARVKSDTDLIDDLRQFKSVPDALFEDAEALRMTIAVLAADYAVCDSFSTLDEGPLSIPILIYGGVADSLTETELSAWKLESCVASTLTMFDGDHFFLRENEAAFLNRLTDDLRRLD